jgi:hypothetical protein
MVGVLRPEALGPAVLEGRPSSPWAGAVPFTAGDLTCDRHDDADVLAKDHAAASATHSLISRSHRQPAARRDQQTVNMFGAARPTSSCWWHDAGLALLVIGRVIAVTLARQIPVPVRQAVVGRKTLRRASTYMPPRELFGSHAHYLRPAI